METGKERSRKKESCIFFPQEKCLSLYEKRSIPGLNMYSKWRQVCPENWDREVCVSRANHIISERRNSFARRVEEESRRVTNTRNEEGDVREDHSQGSKKRPFFFFSFYLKGLLLSSGKPGSRVDIDIDSSRDFPVTFIRESITGDERKKEDYSSYSCFPSLE